MLKISVFKSKKVILVLFHHLNTDKIAKKKTLSNLMDST